MAIDVGLEGRDSVDFSQTAPESNPVEFGVNFQMVDESEVSARRYMLPFQKRMIPEDSPESFSGSFILEVRLLDSA
jgi:hypothetical protein